MTLALAFLQSARCPTPNHLRSIVAGLACFACFAFNPAAQAKTKSKANEAETDQTGRVGIGGTYSIAGYGGLNAKFALAPRFSLELTIGARHFRPKNDELRSSTALALAPGFTFWMLPPRKSGVFLVALGLSGRFALITGNGAHQFNIEAPLVSELYFGPYFSIAPEFGLVIRINGVRGADGTDTDELDAERQGHGEGLGIELGQNTGLFFGGSFRFYFPNKRIRVTTTDR